MVHLLVVAELLGEYRIELNPIVGLALVSVGVKALSLKNDGTFYWN